MAVTVMTVGAVIVLLGTLLPWVRTGGRRRNSYDLLALVERLGYAPDGPAATALRWWPVIAVLVVLAVVAAWWGWLRVGGLVGLGAVAYTGAVAVGVAGSGSELVHVQAGPAVTIVGAILLAGGALTALVDALRNKAGGRDAEAERRRRAR